MTADLVRATWGLGTPSRAAAVPRPRPARRTQPTWQPGFPWTPSGASALCWFLHSNGSWTWARELSGSKIKNSNRLPILKRQCSSNSNQNDVSKAFVQIFHIKITKENKQRKPSKNYDFISMKRTIPTLPCYTEDTTKMPNIFSVSKEC